MANTSGLKGISDVKLINVETGETVVEIGSLQEATFESKPSLESEIVEVIIGDLITHSFLDILEEMAEPEVHTPLSILEDLRVEKADQEIHLKHLTTYHGMEHLEGDLKKAQRELSYLAEITKRVNGQIREVFDENDVALATLYEESIRKQKFIGTVEYLDSLYGGNFTQNMLECEQIELEYLETVRHIMSSDLGQPVYRG